MVVVTRRDGVATSPGRSDWDGGFSSNRSSDLAEDRGGEPDGSAQGLRAILGRLSIRQSLGPGSPVSAGRCCEAVAGNDCGRDAAAVVAPAEPAQAPSGTEPGSADIGEPATVGWIAQAASNGHTPKSQALVEERVEGPSRAIKADPQNEPHFGIFTPIETPGRRAPRHPTAYTATRPTRKGSSLGSRSWSRIKRVISSAVMGARMIPLRPWPVAA